MVSAGTVPLLLLLARFHFSDNQPLNWINEIFPKKLSDIDFTLLPSDNMTGCKISRCPMNYFYYVYSDGCTEVPTHAPISGKSLNLRNTKVTKIRSGDFSNWSQLLALNIEINYYLTEIMPGAFSGLNKLTNLSICDNYNLKPLKPNVFKGLVSLKELSFIKNNMRNLSEFVILLSPNILPSLTVLDLSQNPLDAINSGDFKPMNGTKLEKLTLILCGISDISGDALAPLVELHLLNVGNNNLNSDTLADVVSNISETAIHLETFGIAGNLLHKELDTLLQTIAVTNISDLQMNDNHYDLMQPKLFPVMPNLRRLDMSEIMAIDVDKNVFNQTFLPNLTSLIVARNKFSNVLPNLLLPNLVEFDISDNSYESSYSTSLFTISDFIFDGMDKLKVLNLGKNLLYHVKRYMLYGLSSLEVLNLSNCSIYIIDPYAFSNLTNLRHLDLSYNKFVMNSTLTAKTFSGLVSLESLQLDYCELNAQMSDMFNEIPTLKYLTLRGNYLTVINPLWFKSLPSLSQLDLTDNDISGWDERMFTENNHLKILYLSSNRMRYFTYGMLDDFVHLDDLDLRENQWDCTCATVQIIHDYLIDKNLSLSSLPFNHSRIACFSPPSLTSTGLIDYIKIKIDQHHCNQLRNEIIAIVLFASIFIALVGVISMVVYYLRWHIRYWIFLFRQAMRYNYFPGKKKTTTTTSTDNDMYKYDAFVSYSHEDRNFVVRLVTMLETQAPYYSLCVFERDFSVGDVITDSVLDCLSSSRRTILVLSDSFARSTWCLWEMQLAQHKRLFFKDEETEPLVIIKIGEIMDRHMTPTLRYLIRSRVYLQWNPDPKKQKMFWQRLKEALVPPKVLI